MKKTHVGQKAHAVKCKVIVKRTDRATEVKLSNTFKSNFKEINDLKLISLKHVAAIMKIKS